MDLLRAVISRQRAVWLAKMGKLVRSTHFRGQWRSTYGLPPTSLAFEQEAGLGGEIVTPGIVSSTISLHRAAFLCDVPGFKTFVSRAEKFDLWYCLSTGVQEIQEAAIAQFKQHFRLAALAGIGDPGNFPWTPWLTKQIEELVSNVIRTSVSRSEVDGLIPIFGVCQPPPLKYHFKTSQVYYKYLEYFVLRTLQGQDSRGRVDTIERAIESYFDVNNAVRIAILIGAGYLHHRSREEVIATIANDEDYGNDFLNEVVPTFSHEGLLIAATAGLRIEAVEDVVRENINSNQILTKRNVLQARACLDDSVTRAFLSPSILEIYKLVALEQDSLCGEITFIQMTGIKSRATVLTLMSLESESTRSAQGSQMVDSVLAARVKGDSILQTLAVEVTGIRGLTSRLL